MASGAEGIVTYVSASAAQPPEDRAPRHPRIGRPSLILHCGYHSGVSIDMLDRFPVGAISKPLVHAAIDSGFVAAAQRAELGVVLPPETWRNQLPLRHSKRSEAFRLLGFALDDVLDIGAGALPEAFSARYAASVIDAQLKAGTTIALTPAHVHDFEDGAGRDNDVRLARLAASEFAARAARMSPLPGGGPRQVFAALIVQGGHVPFAVHKLTAQYADLEVDGYWLSIANARLSHRELLAVAELALRLQEMTGRPVVVTCIGHIQLALLAYGVAATCIGHHGGSLGFPPVDLRAERELEREEDDDENGIGVHTYHPEILGAFALGEKYDALRAYAFRRWPCSCGAHDAETQPQGKEIRTHNLHWHLREASWVAAQAEANRAGAMTERIERTRTRRVAELKMSALKPGWRGVAAGAQRVGRDAGRGDEPAEGRV